MLNYRNIIFNQVNYRNLFEVTSEEKMNQCHYRSAYD